VNCKTTLARLFAVAAAATIIAGCGQSGGPVPVSTGGADSIMGGGSSFVYPVMNKWASDYNKSTGVQVNYQSLGSSGGIKQFSQRTLDFGATDAPMNEEQLAEVGGEVLHIPVVMGAVVVTYNVPGVKEPLTLSGPVIADIYLGKIKKWNDSAITALNSGIALPDTDIVSVRRADGSGTTFIFADFLGKTSPEWKEKVGVGNALSWPANSLGGKGNEGVSAMVQRSENSIGYVELVYALEAKLPTASIINQSGKPVQPSVESVTAAAADLTAIPEDLRMSITNAPGDAAYPMAGITWVVARPEMANGDKAGALKKFLNYALSDEAQSLANELKYSKLPPKILEPALAKVNQIKGQR
jgi:phosphate transport system substrate-binding protein